MPLVLPHTRNRYLTRVFLFLSFPGKLEDFFLGTSQLLRRPRVESTLRFFRRRCGHGLCIPSSAPSRGRMRNPNGRGTSRGKSLQQQRLSEKLPQQKLFRTPERAGRDSGKAGTSRALAGLHKREKKIAGVCTIMCTNRKTERNTRSRKKVNRYKHNTITAGMSTGILTSSHYNRETAIIANDAEGIDQGNNWQQLQSIQESDGPETLERPSKEAQTFREHKRSARSRKNVKKAFRNDAKARTRPAYKSSLMRRKRSQSVPLYRRKRTAITKTKPSKQLRPSYIKNRRRPPSLSGPAASTGIRRKNKVEVQNSVLHQINNSTKTQQSSSSSPGQYFCSLIEDISGWNEPNGIQLFPSIKGDMFAHCIKLSSGDVRTNSMKNLHRNVSNRSHRHRPRRKRKGKSLDYFPEDLLNWCDDSFVVELMHESPDKMMIRLHRQVQDGGSRMISAWSPLRLLQSPQDTKSQSKSTHHGSFSNNKQASSFLGKHFSSPK